VSSPSTRIRKTNEDEIPTIVHLINLAYSVENFARGDRISEAVAQNKLLEPESTFLVVEEQAPDAARLMGAVFVVVRGDRGYFGPLAVDPAAQGRGLGKALVAAAEAYCRDRHCRRVDLDVVNIREELLTFYRSLGYEVTGRADYPRPERLNRPVHLVLMSKQL
jgi:ribosomal protein S18 acetylase RimI-like enzyme